MSSVYGVVSVTIKIDLPDALVAEAQANGLLESKRLGEILSSELRRTQVGKTLEQVRNENGEQIPIAEVQGEVNAVRKEKRQREGGR
jgi:hypothetical protein